MASCFLTIQMRINPDYVETEEGFEFKCQYKIGIKWTDAQARIIIPKHRLRDFQKFLKEEYGQ